MRSGGVSSASKCAKAVNDIDLTSTRMNTDLRATKTIFMEVLRLANRCGAAAVSPKVNRNL
jgi:hypothetical protein